MSKELFKRLISSIILLPVVLFVVIEGSYYFIILILICFFVSVNEWQKMKIKNYIKMCGFLFLIFSFYTIFEIRRGYNSYWPFLIIISISIASDIGGYFFGKILKGPRLTKISPNKTYAGIIGAYFFCLILYLIFLKLEIINSNYLYHFLFFVFIISSISQLGDILVSYFKRLSKIKDTGKIIPGHGGLLDRIDGMIFAFPASYFFLLIDNFGFSS